MNNHTIVSMGSRIPAFEEKKATLLKELQETEPEGLFSYLITKGKFVERVGRSPNAGTCLLSGCLYNIWIDVKFINDKLVINLSSDSKLLNGILYMLCELMSGLTAREVIAADLKFFSKIIPTNLSSLIRINTLGELIEYIKKEANKQVLDTFVA